MINMMGGAPLSAERSAFQLYLRTGRRTSVTPVHDVECKFNPYHDVRNGRFTFAPGGPRPAAVRNSRPGRTDDRGTRSGGRSPTTSTMQPPTPIDDSSDAVLTDAVYRPEAATQSVELAQNRANPPTPRGGNIRAFDDPMTLEQVFPGLRTVPGGSIIAALDPLDIFGPGIEVQAGLNADIAQSLIRQIKAIDPEYRSQSLGIPTTLQGQINQNNSLRFDRAAALYRVRGELAPLQIETIRFVQRAADIAYVEGLKMLRMNRLKIRLSEQEGLGNFVDRQVRDGLRDEYNRRGISMIRGEQVRVNAREYNTSGTDLSFRRPDARTGNVALDVTVTRKTLATPQVRGFFLADFKPQQVIIVRPRQLEGGGSYVITRPEQKR